MEVMAKWRPVLESPEKTQFFCEKNRKNFSGDSKTGLKFVIIIPLKSVFGRESENSIFFLRKNP